MQATSSAKQQQTCWDENIGLIKEALKPDFDAIDHRFDSLDESLSEIGESLSVIKKHLGIKT